eukprot:gene9119-12300_t
MIDESSFKSIKNGKNNNVTTRQERIKRDYVIMKSINSLMEQELEFNRNSLESNVEIPSNVDFLAFRATTKKLLESLLLKLEDSIEYQKYLESELAGLENTNFNNLDKENITNYNSHEKIEKDQQLKSDQQQQIRELNAQLVEANLEISRLKVQREVELRAIILASGELEKKIASLNSNFSQEN